MKKKKLTKTSPAPRADKTEENRFLFDPHNGSYEKWARETLVGKTGPFEDDSPEWFAERIIRKIDEIRFLLAENAGDHPTIAWRYKEEAADRAASEAFYLGQFTFRWEEIFIRDRAEQDRNIVFGVMHRVEQQSGATETREEARRADFFRKRTRA